MIILKRRNFIQSKKTVSGLYIALYCKAYGGYVYVKQLDDFSVYGLHSAYIATYIHIWPCRHTRISFHKL